MATTEATKRSVRLPEVISERLEDVRRRESSLCLKTGLVDALALFLVAMFVALVIDWGFTLFSTAVRETLTFTTLGVGVIGLLVFTLLPSLKRRSLADLAADVDGSVDGLEERWQTVTEIATSESREFAGSPVMFDQVVREAVAREPVVNVDEVVTSETFKKHAWIFGGVVAGILLLFLIDAPRAWVLAQRFFAPASPISLTQITSVEGSTAVPRGEPLRLHAEVSRRMPESATLFLRDTEGNVTDVSLTVPNKAGTGFEHAFAAVDQPFSYQFRAGDGETGWYDITVHDRPRLTAVQFHMTSPEYTGLPAVDKSELPAKIRAVEGSMLEVDFTVDQPLENFRLEFGKEEFTTLTPDKDNPLHYVFRQKLVKTIRFSPVFKSEHGLENLRIPSCQVVVYADRAPQVTIVSPEKEISVRPDDKVEVTINARDDFGVARAELIAYIGQAPDMENAVVLPVEPVEQPGTVQANQVDAAPGTDSQTVNVKQGEDAKHAESTNAQSTQAPDRVNPNGTATEPKESESGKPGKNDPRDSGKSASGKTDSDESNTGKSNTGNSPNAKGEDTPINSTSPKSNSAAAQSNASSGNPSSPGNSKSSNNSNTSNNQSSRPQGAGAPPRTVVMPIPLGNQAGDKNVRGNIKLDVSRFQLKQGEQLQYMVRVYDSRNTGSSGQSYADASQPSKPEEMLAQADPKASGTTQNKPGNADQRAMGQQSANGNRSNNAGQPAANPQNASSGTASSANNTSTDAARNSQGNTSQSNSASNPSANSAANGNASTNNTSNPSSNPSANESSNSSSNISSNSSNDAVARVSSEGGSQNTGDAQANASSGANNAQNDPKGQASSGNNSSGQNSSSQSSSSGGQSESGSKSSPSDQESKGQMSGASQPENPMSRRKLDVESQSSASSTMRIHIDNWAGSFESQQREKLEVQIDPVLKELDAVLAKSLEFLKPAVQFAAEGKALDDEHITSVRGAETQIERGESLVGELVKKTDGTPYAFIGLQLVDITGTHVSPAHVEVHAITVDPAEKQMGHLQQGEFHILRARERLAELTKTYENVKRNARLVEELQRIKNMYQVFVEDSLSMLNSPKPGINSRDRKIAELELDKEFLDKYTELQKRWQEILAELAKALAKDPRLLERYMNMSRSSADTLRDQLTILHERQKDLLVPTDQLVNPPKEMTEAKPQELKTDPKADPKKDDKPAAAKRLTAVELIRATLVREMAGIAQSAAEVQENLTTWLPRNMDVDDPRVAPTREQAVKVAGLAGKTAAAVAKQDQAAVAKLTESLSTELKAFEESLAGLAKGDDPQLVTNINRRLARVRDIQQKLSAWSEKQDHVNNAELNRVLELDQHRLAEDTLAFVDKLSNLEAQLAGLPPDVATLGDQLRDVIRYDVLVDQMSSELRLRDADLKESRDLQQRAIEGFAKAEASFDKLIDRIIEEQDKEPPQVPDLDNFQLPTLEDLLARLEAEQDLAELLGIPNRPTNLQQMQDWLMRSGSGGGMGSGAAAAGGLRAQMMERARQDAMRSIRKAGEVGNDQPNATPARRWNTIASQLDDMLRQGRGNTPPKQYRQAIERYFELISGAEESAKSAPKSKPTATESKTPNQK